jgi:hypothetical protein
MRYLEPGRKRRRTRLPATRSLWLIAAGVAAALAFELLLR